MSRMDAVIERLRALPESQQEQLAAGIESLLDLDLSESMLTPEQWAEVERTLANDDGIRIPHEEVVALMRAKFGE